MDKRQLQTKIVVLLKRNLKDDALECLVLTPYLETEQGLELVTLDSSDGGLAVVRSRPGLVMSLAQLNGFQEITELGHSVIWKSKKRFF